MTTELKFYDPAGRARPSIMAWSQLEYARGEGKVGYMYLDLDPYSVDTTLFKKDCWLAPWRSTGTVAPYLDGETIFLVRRVGITTSAQRQKVFRVKAVDANYLWSGANVAYFSGDAKAEQTDYADDMLKAIASQNRGSAATDTTRSLAAYLTIQADASAAPAITRAFPREQVLQVMQNICSDSLSQGVYLAFDTVWTPSVALDFRTYIGQRGNNHGGASSSRVVFSEGRGNLTNAEWYTDWENEYTVVSAGNQGAAGTAVVETAINTAALGESPFSRRELWYPVDNRDTTTSAAIQSAANGALQKNRVRHGMTGTIVDTDSCKDGIHFRYGDLVRAENEQTGWGFDAHIDALKVVISRDGGEVRTNQIRAEA
jgi:hypothetical protein